jgi:hypothetical protein
MLRGNTEEPSYLPYREENRIASDVQVEVGSLRALNAVGSRGDVLIGETVNYWLYSMSGKIVFVNTGTYSRGVSQYGFLRELPEISRHHCCHRPERVSRTAILVLHCWRVDQSFVKGNQGM